MCKGQGQGTGTGSDLRLRLRLGFELDLSSGSVRGDRVDDRVGARVRLGLAAHLSGSQVSRLVTLSPLTSSQKCCLPALDLFQPPLSSSFHPSTRSTLTTWVDVEWR